MTTMDWSKLLNYNNFRLNDNSRTSKFELSRTPFQIDYDRIIFSEDFRRLDKKTQVHPLKINDHVHARLTHSLEVSCVGRSLGCKAGEFLRDQNDFHPYPKIIESKKNSDIIMPIITGQILQTACLAHDIGNPPFGHAGEELIQDWFRERRDHYLFESLSETEINDLMNFEGNAQGFRILTRTSMRRDDGGMQLSYAVIASTMKYPWVYSKQLPKTKFGSFSSESRYLQQVAEFCGLLPSDTSTKGSSFARHPFAYLSEAADDICYNIMDLEDAYELKILDYETVFNIFSQFCANISGFKPSQYKDANDKAKLSHLRAKAISECINAVICEFKDRYKDIISGTLDFDYSLLENSSSHMQAVMNKAKETSRERVFKSERKSLLEIAANQALSTLLSNFCRAVFEMHSKGYENISGYNNKVIELMGNKRPEASDSIFYKYQKVIDHIAGMTDNYAIRISKNMNGIVE